MLVRLIIIDSHLTVPLCRFQKSKSEISGQSYHDMTERTRKNNCQKMINLKMFILFQENIVIILLFDCGYLAFF